MEQPDLNYLKMVIRSILTSSPNRMTISQILNEYNNYEGCNLPFKHLGFNTIYELLENMTDVLKIPPNPNFNSFITLIVDKKTSHLRELVVNQKTKKQRPKRNIFTTRTNNNHLLKSANFKSRVNNHNNYRNEYTSSRYEYNTPRYESSSSRYESSTPRNDNSARGYDHVRIKSFNSKSNGIVTPNLKNCIENLFSTTEVISIKTLKFFLINHPDYKQLGTINIEESINMLKYFIYIDRGGVHLKDSSFEIFPSKTSGTRKYSKPISGSYLNNIVDENEELSFCEQNNDNFDEIDDSCFENLIISDLNDSESKNNDIVPTQKNVENKLVSSKVQPFTSKSFHHKIVPKIECEANSDKLNYTKSQKDDYKSAIVAIIARSHEPITVKKVLAIFEDEQGYTFPFQKFSCGTCMDFFRLYPDMFKLEDQCSTNSIVSLEKQIILKPKITIRRQLNKTSIFNNAAITSKILNQSKIVSELLSNKDDHQKNKEPIIDESCQAHSIKSIDLFEMYDADTILDTMKVKMRSILSKHKDGILCNDFMDIYGKEYNSHFNFSEYGFKSMRDMAYKLPSVFYVKVTDDDHECILFEADRRSEFENIIDDPSLYYKNIPKTILYNLSNFFDKYRTGVKFNKLMSLYCAEYGRAYEPQKYGYSSEKHMFESLDKMVVFKNDELFTVDPFAYTKCFKSKDQIDNCDKNTILLPDHDFLLHYSGKDICNGKFKYSKVELNDQKYIKVIVAEIYNPGSFYIQLAAEVNNLNSFMDRLQLYYKDNEKSTKLYQN
ncbi:LOW QUALITY PROTEIN: uncharacterized protein LOC112599489 [Melanaphis sacchari]|uniref:LOW QUALITY PROTEIN: uncharacterized protein LOC112599489 n=1 Tax=Melanaphis sacchari TaxID=742174 RepID=UPI000DC14ABF|nr:LOW QUALITY PROTEIN: uncharacterized protein LOC112599489 [Melanaphis sacchari]